MMVGILFALIISIGIPFSLFIYALFKKQTWPFLLGVMAFVISQVFFRMPILQLLEAHCVQYSLFSVTNPILFSILLALSAAIVEEFARYIFMRFLMKKWTWQAGFLFGAGHGGIEAVLLVGISAIVILFTGGASDFGGNFLLGGSERLFAILLHIGLSLLVLRGIVESRYKFLFGAIFIHTFVNSLVGIVPLYVTPGVAIIIIEVSLAVISIGLFSYHLFLKRRGVFK